MSRVRTIGMLMTLAAAAGFYAHDYLRYAEADETFWASLHKYRRQSMTFDVVRLSLSASIANLTLVSSAEALEAPRASDKAVLASCLKYVDDFSGNLRPCRKPDQTRGKFAGVLHRLRDRSLLLRV